MEPFLQEIVKHLKLAFADKTDFDEKSYRLAKIGVYIKKLKDKEREKLFNHALRNIQTLAKDNQMLCKSYLFYLSKEDEILRAIAQDLFLYLDSLEAYHYLIWKIRISMFQFSGEIKPETLNWVKEHCMRPSYEQMMEMILACVQDTEEYRPKKGIKKVALVVGQLLSELHAPSRTALMIAMGLINEYGLEVHIINTNLIPVTRPLEYFGCTFPHFNEKLSGKQFFQYSDQEFGTHKLTLYSQLPGPFTLNSMVNIWNYIEAEKFDALINLGDVLFALDYFMGKIPILGIPTLRELPISRADQYLLVHDTLNTEEQDIVEKHCTRPACLGVSFSVNPEKGENTFCKSAYGVPEDAFVFVVVGNRLSQEVDKTFLNLCHNLLKANTKNIIFFVGDHPNMSALLEQNQLTQTGQAKSFDFQQDLRSFYEMCDVYLNPFRSGGGVSAQMAIADNIPVVTLNKGDVGANLTPELRCETVSDYESLALDLANDEAKYKQWQGAMKEIAMSRQGNRKNIDIIYNLLNDLNTDAIARFEHNPDALTQVETF